MSRFQTSNQTMMLEQVRLTCVAGALLALLGAAQPPQPDRSPWVARTTQWTISWEEFSARYAEFLASTGSRDNPGLREVVLNNLVNELLLIRDTSDSFGFWRRSHAETVERMRHQTVLAYLKDREVYARITVTEEEARQAFSRSYEQIAARHLYAQTEEEAIQLLALLRAGVSFETLAGQTFTDSTLRTSGGFLGYFSWGDMDPAFEDAAYQLRVGEISEPVATSTGYSIIRVEDRIANPLLTESQFIQRRAHVDRVVRIRKRRPAEREYLQSVLPEGSILFHEEGLRAVGLALQRPSSGLSKEGSDSLICATLPDRVLQSDDVVRALGRLPAEQRMGITSSDAVRAAIRGIILQERLLKIALARGYDTVGVVRETMRRREESLFFRNQVQEIIRRSAVREEDLRTFYEMHVADFMEERQMQVQELIVGRSELADSLKHLLDRGADLADLARRFSLRRTSASQGGMMPVAPLSRFGGLRDLLWQSPLGSTVGPIRVGEAVGLFRVASRHEGRVRSFTECKEQVLRMIQFERQRTILASHFDDLRRRVPVTINRSRLMTTPLTGVSEH